MAASLPVWYRDVVWVLNDLEDYTAREIDMINDIINQYYKRELRADIKEGSWNVS